MRKKSEQLIVRSKLWIENGGKKTVFCQGRFKILNAIKRHGSINSAAKELKMSYRTIWGKIKESEKCLGQPLLVTKTGGGKGGGSTLTPLAETLIEQFAIIQKEFEQDSDKLSKQLSQVI